MAMMLVVDRPGERSGHNGWNSSYNMPQPACKTFSSNFPGCTSTVLLVWCRTPGLKTMVWPCALRRLDLSRPDREPRLVFRAGFTNSPDPEPAPILSSGIVRESETGRRHRVVIAPRARLRLSWKPAPRLVGGAGEGQVLLFCNVFFWQTPVEFGFELSPFADRRCHLAPAVQISCPIRSRACRFAWAA